MADSTPPSSQRLIDPTNPRVRSLTNIVVTATALITAITALVKPQDTSVTKASYEELAASLKTMGEQNAKLHDDQVALRSYIDGYVKAKQQQDVELAKETASAVEATTSPSTAPAGPVLPVKPPPAPPPPPQVSPKPTAVTPPPFASVEQKAKR
jgi:hypothetical protein